MNNNTCPHCNKLIAPVATELSIFYMRDNHSFYRLTSKTKAGLLEEAINLLDECDWGLLGSVAVLGQDGKSFKQVGCNAHARGKEKPGYWRDEVNKWMASLMEDGDVSKLIAAGKIKQHPNS
jgi:hypothetical protein